MHLFDLLLGSLPLGKGEAPWAEADGAGFPRVNIMKNQVGVGAVLIPDSKNVTEGLQ